MSRDSSQRATVEIMGEQLPVKAADEEHMDRAVAIVEEKIDNIKKQSRDASRLQIALLASLNIAGAIVQLEESPDQLELSEETLNRLDELEQRIDSLISEDSHQ